jgi:RHS repeat-associated protein
MTCDSSVGAVSDPPFFVHPAGQQTARLYDGLGRLTRLTEDYSGIDRYTDFAYDRASRLTRQTGYTNGTSGAESTDYAYNKAGVKTLVTYPDSGTVSFVLDSVGRVTSQTDPRNVTLAFDYDPMGRVLTKHEGTNVYWTYSYNARGDVTLARKGTSAGGDQVARTDRLYNGLGQLTLETQQITGALTKSVGYDYDLVGNVTDLYYPGGDVTIAHTVTAGNQTDLIKRNGTQIGDYNYVGSQVKRLLYETGANDVTADRYYDGAGRMTRLAWDQVSNTLPKFAYSYDPAGNILTKTHDHRSGDPIEKYGIDSLYRLTDARYDFRTLTHDFDYDDLGNWLTYTNNATAQTRLHNAVNEITKIGTTELLYDAAGNLTKDNAGGNGPYHTFYDAENRLTRIEQDNSTLVASYKHDALGRRIEFIDAVGSVTKRYLHDGDQVIEEYNGAATPARQRYYIWGNYVDELLLLNDDAGDDSDYFVCHDQIYSPHALLNSTGSIVERYDYDAYGQPVIYTATATGGGDSDWWDGDETTSETSAKGLKYLFTGRELDNLDGNTMKLYYYRARTYDPLFGRFLQRDPIEYMGGMSLYEYVGSHSQVYIDPYGLLPWRGGPFEGIIREPPPSMQPVPREWPPTQAGPPTDWPMPPGFGPGWEWVGRKPTDKPVPPKADPGHWEDPEGYRYRLHPEDQRHNPHWDKLPRGKGPHEQIPIDDKPIFKPSPVSPKPEPILPEPRMPSPGQPWWLAPFRPGLFLECPLWWFVPRFFIEPLLPCKGIECRGITA